MAHHFPLRGCTGGNHSVYLLRLSLQEKSNCGLEGTQTTIREQVVRKTSGWRESVQLTAGNAFFLVGIWERISRKDSPAKLSKQLIHGGGGGVQEIKKQKTSQFPISNLPFEWFWQIGYLWHSCLTWISSSRNKAKSAGPGGWSRAVPFVNQGKG